MLKFGILLLILIFSGFGDGVRGQATCGTYTAPPPSTNNPDSLVYDRFGNAYDFEDLLIPPQVAGATNSGGCDTKYFNLIIENDVPSSYSNIVREVFCYLATVVQQRQNKQLVMTVGRNRKWISM